MPRPRRTASYGVLTDTVTGEVVCGHKTHEEAESPEN